MEKKHGIERSSGSGFPLEAGEGKFLFPIIAGCGFWLPGHVPIASIVRAKGAATKTMIRDLQTPSTRQLQHPTTPTIRYFASTNIASPLYDMIL